MVNKKYQVNDDFCAALLRDVDRICTTSSLDELHGMYLNAVKHLYGIYEVNLDRVFDLQKGDLNG